jgi:hypothetical protein
LVQEKYQERENCGKERRNNNKWKYIVNMYKHIHGQEITSNEQEELRELQTKGY